MNKTQIPEDLEFISIKTRIVVLFETNKIEVKLFPNYPDEYHLKLTLIPHSDYATFDDLVGNNYKSKYHRKGYGKQIVNIGIQALYLFYGIQPTSANANNIELRGKTSNAGDSPKVKIKEKLRDSRNAFWSSFGFELENPKAFSTRMKSTLALIRPNKNGSTANNLAVYIPLTDFWEIEKRPLIINEDLRKLRSITFQNFGLESLPSLNDLNTIEARADEINSKIFWATTGILYFSGCVLILSNGFSEETLGLSLIWFFPAFWVSQRIGDKIKSRLQLVKTSERLSNQRNEKLSKVIEYISILEEEYNGFLWRIYPGLVKISPSFGEEKYLLIAEASVQTSFQDRSMCEPYIRCIEEAKATLLQPD